MFTLPNFNLPQFNQCKAIINQCPKTGPIPSVPCETKIIKTNPICKQAGLLAKQILMPVSTIDITKENKNYIIRALYIADGKYIFYNLAPIGKLTKLNPQNNLYNNSLFELNQLTQAIPKQFHANSFSLSVWFPNQKQPDNFTAGTFIRNGHRNINPNTLFQTGSTTKTFTAALIKQAILQKKLTLSNTVGEYLPQYPKWKSITIGELVNQTSGIPDYDQSKNWWKKLVKKPNKQWTSNQLLSIAYSMPMQFKPNHRWAYSNSNYVLLGLILQKIEKQPIENLFDKLFHKVYLFQTYYSPHDYNKKIKINLTHGYFNQYDQTEINGSWLQSAGAVLSTPDNLVRWFDLLLSGKSKLALDLNQDFYNCTTGMPTSNLSQTAYGFGVFRMNTPFGLIYFTPGLTPGYTTLMGYSPRLNIYFAYCISGAGINYKDFHKIVLTKLLTILDNPLRHTKQLIQPSKQFNFPKIG